MKEWAKKHTDGFGDVDGHVGRGVSPDPSLVGCGHSEVILGAVSQAGHGVGGIGHHLALVGHRPLKATLYTMLDDVARDGGPAIVLRGSPF